ncbi:MAG: segregation and condensation protein A [Candidatus Hydrogenedentota bacterium]
MSDTSEHNETSPVPEDGVAGDAGLDEAASVPAEAAKAAQEGDMPPAAAQDAPAPDAAAFIVDQATDEVLRIHLDQFEGPFEVLLYLIKSQEIDIFDIPIVTVTEQYLRFLELLRGENLDVAGEFLVMAATLIQIKSRMILPVEVEEEEEEEIEEEDPRLELVEKLLEYRKYRELGEQLGDCHERAQDRFPRMVKPKVEVVDDDGYIEVSLYDLTQAVRNIMRFIREPVIQRLAMEAYSVDQKVGYLEDLLVQRDTIAWSELFALSRDKLEVVCYFLAVLELCRMRRVRAHQHQEFGEIRIFPRTFEEALDEDDTDVVETGGSV